MKTSLALAAALLFAASASAQNQQTGFPPFGTFQNGQFDSVNLQNLNVNFSLPVVSVPGRGLNFSPPISSNSLIWYPQFIQGYGTSWYPVSDVWGYLTWGWKRGGFSGALMYSSQGYTCQGQGTTHYWNFQVQENNGTIHPFSTSFYTVATGCHYFTTPTTGVATDLSGWYLNANPNTQFDAYSPAGTSMPDNQSTDSNGNYMTENGNSGSSPDTYTDTLGRTVLVITTNGNTRTYAYKDSNGNSQTTTMTLQSFSIQTNFQCPNIGEGGGTATLPVSIVYPNGQTYSFQYESTPGYTGKITGRISQVTLPTGGTYQYQYSQGVDCKTGDPLTMTRTITNGSSVSTWQYSRSVTTQGQVTTTTTTVTAPKLPYDAAPNQRVFTVATNQTCISPYSTCTIQTDQTYQGSAASGTLLQTVTTYINPNDLISPYAVVTALPTTGTNTEQSKVVTTFDTYGNLLTKNEYDGGTNVPGPLLRTTTNTYLNSSTYLNIGISNRLASTVIANGAGTTIAQTKYEYDNYTAGITASGAVQHNSSYNTSYTTRGNVTAVESWRNTDGTWLTTRFQYDDAGNALSSTDPKSNTTTFSYADSWGNTGCTPSGGNGAAYVTTVTNALTQKTTGKYNSCTASVASVTDANNQTTSFAHDSMGRTTSVAYPDTGQTTYSYTDSAPPSMSVTSKINSTQNLVSTTLFDNLGRVKQTQLSDPEGTDYQDTTYDLIGRVYSQSNPYRSTSDPTYGLTTQFYDALSRSTVVVPADATVPGTNTCGTDDLCTSYSGNTTTVTDEAGTSRKTVTNGLGQLTQVFENPSNLNYETDYQYDVLNNLLCAAQKGTNSGTFTNCASIPAAWRPRTFTYDSLSELLTAQNPEIADAVSGADCAVTYTYDNDGNALTKTSPLPNQQHCTSTVTATYTYDPLNRVTSQTYSDGTPGGSYYYDYAGPTWGYTMTNPIGRLTAENSWNGYWVSGQIFSYDAMGRVINNSQCTPYSCSATPNQVTYTYNLIGGITSYTNGEGTTFSQSFDNAGRATQLTSSFSDSQHPANLATVSNSSVGYWPHGPVRLVTLGNNLSEDTLYNPRLQLCRIQINSWVGYLNTCTQTGVGANLDFTMGYNYGTGNNGNVTSMVAIGAQTFNRSYTYDALNRISTMTDSATSQACKALSWTIDPWGNRTAQSVTSGTCNTSSFSVNTNNQLTGSPYQYDAAGNMTHDANHSYTYDAENRLTAVDGGSTSTYQYDQNGRRVEKNVGGTKTDYIYDLSGNAVAEMNSACGFCWTVGYNYFDGALNSIYTNNTTYFVHSDHLGSTRLLTEYPTPNTAECDDYYPYGELVSCGGTTTTNHKYTSQERDSESNLDNSQARYRGSSLGRFMSPDPYNAGADLLNPQSWNMYSYAVNNPLRYTDPLGLYCYYGDTSPDSQDWNDASQYDFESNQNDCTAPDEFGNAGLWFDDPSTTVIVSDTGDDSIVFTSTGNNGITPVYNLQVFSTTCPAVPLAPAVNGNLRQNMAEAKIQTEPSYGASDAGPVDNTAYELFWFKSQVQAGGPWDVKTQGNEYDNFGNFNFGATGTSLGLAPGTILRTAGYAQRTTPSSEQYGGDPGSLPGMFLNPSGGVFPYGDDPQGQGMIMLGIQYAANGCGH